MFNFLITNTKTIRISGFSNFKIIETSNIFRLNQPISLELLCLFRYLEVKLDMKTDIFTVMFTLYKVLEPLEVEYYSVRRTVYEDILGRLKFNARLEQVMIVY